jgi:hypothetical protein
LTKSFRVTQEEGMFLITGPGVLHQGFNSGSNVAEAVNCLNIDWISDIFHIQRCLCRDNPVNNNYLEVLNLLTEPIGSESDDSIINNERVEIKIKESLRATKFWQCQNRPTPNQQKMKQISPLIIKWKPRITNEEIETIWENYNSILKQQALFRQKSNKRKKLVTFTFDDN